MKKFIEYFLWISFAILWVVLWFWIVTHHYSYSEDAVDQWWYMDIANSDTSSPAYKYYESVKDSLKDTLVDGEEEE